MDGRCESRPEGEGTVGGDGVREEERKAEEEVGGRLESRPSYSYFQFSN